jgi:acetylornithine deacetylase/succinyl-diaminopimelate desuccinylase-like protein
MNIDATVQKVMDTIDVDELVKVALDLGNIDSPTRSEGPVADYVLDWLTRQRFAARKVGVLPDRPNVIGTLHRARATAGGSCSTATWTRRSTRTSTGQPGEPRILVVR